MSPDNLLHKALLLLDRGEIDRGISVLRQVIIEAQTAKKLAVEMRAMCCLGDVFFQNGEYEEALPLLLGVVRCGDLDGLLAYEVSRATLLLSELDKLGRKQGPE